MGKFERVQGVGQVWVGGGCWVRSGAKKEVVEVVWPMPPRWLMASRRGQTLLLLTHLHRSMSVGIFIIRSYFIEAFVESFIVKVMITVVTSLLVLSF